MLKQADLLIAPCYVTLFKFRDISRYELNKDIYFQDSFKSNILPSHTPACKAKAKDRNIECK